MPLNIWNPSTAFKFNPKKTAIPVHQPKKTIKRVSACLPNTLQSENNPHVLQSEIIENEQSTPIQNESVLTPIRMGNGRDCIALGCTNNKGTGPKRASFNITGTTHAIYCFEHKLENMVNVNNKKCEKCTRVPNFNYPSSKIARFCSEHAKAYPGMVNIHKPPCEWEGCTIQPSFGFPEDGKLRFCATHANGQEGVVDLKHKKCRWLGCTVTPGFNYPNYTFGLYCIEHSKNFPGMVNVVKKTCITPDCSGRPTYNLPTEKYGRYCVNCKSPNMINVRDKCIGKAGCINTRVYNFIDKPNPLYCIDCKADNMVDQVSQKCRECRKGASFNYIGNKRPAYCKDHKTNQMIDVKHGTCRDINCTLQPGFNYPEEKKPVYCSQHANPGMIDLKHNYCLGKDCPKHASFNLPGETSRLYCADHKTTDMVNLDKQSCNICGITAKYNYPGETTRLYCSSHSLQGMVDLEKRITCCVEGGCPNLPLFNYTSKKAIYCDTHKKDGMTNLEQEKNCSHSLCPHLPIACLGEKYYCQSHYPDQSAISIMKGECSICDLAPNNYVCKDCQSKQHQKEWTTVCYLKRKVNKNPILDSNLPVRECSKRRPDIYYECQKHVVIVEVDEDQHKRYQPECECARISQIVASIGGKSVIMIRYNPDKITNRGQEVKVPKTDRLEKLVEIVKDELNCEPETFGVKLIQLYYNDDYEIYQPYKVENITTQVAV